VKTLLQQVRDRYEQLRFGMKRIAGEKLVAVLTKRAGDLSTLRDTLAASAGTNADATSQLDVAATALAAAKDATGKATSSFVRIVSNATVSPNWSDGLAQVKVAQQQLVLARKALARVIAALGSAQSSTVGG
jgi:predicted ATP-grasp superfamily ATP-dependent carboligase